MLTWLARWPKERRWRRAAERGDMQASYKLGMSYVGKYSRDRSALFQLRSSQWLYEAACRHLRRAADAGDRDAALQLAQELERGGPPRHWRSEEERYWSGQAARYLKAAADAGQMEAAYLLGAMHLRHALDRDHEPDPERYIRQAADARHARAAHKYGRWLSTQEGREAEAERYLRMIADLDDPDPRACVDLARLLVRTRRSDLAEPYLRTALNSRFTFHHLDIEWMELLGDVLSHAGRAKEAKYWYDYAQARRAANRAMADVADFDD